MDGSIRALAMGVAFSLVAMGFAFAVPRAILTTAEKAIVEEAPIEVSEPVVDDTEEIEIEPIGKDDGGKSRGKGGRNDEKARDNHGAAVSAAARCGGRGRAQGEVSSAIARDENATVEDAKAACEAAKAAEQTPPAGGRGNQSGENAPQAPKDQNTPKDQNDPKDRPTSGSTTDGDSDDSGGADTHPKDNRPGAASKAREKGLQR